MLFSMAAAPFYIPLYSAQRFQFLPIPANTYYFLSFENIVAILMSVRSLSHRGFDLHSSNDQWCWEE